MNKLLVIVRHGEYGNGEHSSLSESGRKQIESLKRVIDALVAETFGDEKSTRVGICFSRFPRAVESIQGLAMKRDDIIMTNLYMVERKDIREPHKILEKVMGIGSVCDASVVTIVVHGEMPAVLAETAHEFVTGKKFANELPRVGTGRGFVVNMVTGEVMPIGWDSLEKKERPP